MTNSFERMGPPLYHDWRPTGGEAFDEPLTKSEVIAIVQPFFKPTIPA